MEALLTQSFFRLVWSSSFSKKNPRTGVSNEKLSLELPEHPASFLHGYYQRKIIYKAFSMQKPECIESRIS